MIEEMRKSSWVGRPTLIIAHTIKLKRLRQCYQIFPAQMCTKVVHICEKSVPKNSVICTNVYSVRIFLILCTLFFVGTHWYTNVNHLATLVYDINFLISI